MAKSGFAKEHLKSFIERVERLLEEKDALTSDIREVYAEAKGQGFDTKTMRQVVALRKMETADRQEQEAMRELYMSALGMLADTPLGQAAMNAAKPYKAPRKTKPLPPHDPDTGEVIEQGIPKPATEAAAVASEDDTEGQKVPAESDYRADDAESGDGMASAPMHANVSEGVTGGESAALPELPAFLRRTPELAHA